MHITERVVGRDVILSLSGKFIFESRKAYNQALQKAKEKNPRKILLNMEGLIYIDSAGLGLLAIGFEQTKLCNIALLLVNPVGAVMRILDLAQLPKIMPVYETEEEALRMTPSVFAHGT